MVCAKAATKAATKAGPIMGDHTLSRYYYEDDMSSEESARSMMIPSASKSTNRAGGSSKKTKAGERLAIVVSHDYVDHLEDSPLVVGPSPRVGVKEAFPFKLHQMLREATIEEFEEVVSWQPHGRAFRVHDRETFIRDIMPRFFQQTKITSFNRQLCLYGFVRLTAAGDDRGAYYHELCIRGRPDLLQRLHRTRVKGTGKKAASSPQTEPDFYRMPYCPEESLGRRVGTVNLNFAQTVELPQPTSPQTTKNDHTTKNKATLITPNPSPRRSISIDRLSPMLPTPFLPMPPKPAVPQHFFPLEPTPISSCFGSSDSTEAFLDSKQFCFAWDDVDI